MQDRFGGTSSASKNKNDKGQRPNNIQEVRGCPLLVQTYLNPPLIKQAPFGPGQRQHLAVSGELRHRLQYPGLGAVGEAVEAHRKDDWKRCVFFWRVPFWGWFKGNRHATNGQNSGRSLKRISKMRGPSVKDNADKLVLATTSGPNCCK